MIYYIQAFDGKMTYQIRDKEPINLKDAQEKAIKIDKNMQAASRSNISGFSRGSSSKSKEERKVKFENQDPQGQTIEKLTQIIKQMEISQAAMQANQTALQNEVVSLKRNKGNNFHPNKSNDRWQNQRRPPPQD